MEDTGVEAGLATEGNNHAACFPENSNGKIPKLNGGKFPISTSYR